MFLGVATLIVRWSIRPKSKMNCVRATRPYRPYGPCRSKHTCHFLPLISGLTQYSSRGNVPSVVWIIFISHVDQNDLWALWHQCWAWKNDNLFFEPLKGPNTYIFFFHFSRLPPRWASYYQGRKAASKQVCQLAGLPQGSILESSYHKTNIGYLPRRTVCFCVKHSITFLQYELE